MLSKQAGDRERGSATAALSSWVSLERAALHLGMGAAALRKALEHRAGRAVDGVTEAELDGVHAEVRAAVAGAVLGAVGDAVSAQIIAGGRERGPGREDREEASP
jgi:hypothetical protein